MGMRNHCALLDLCYLEDVDCDTDLNVVMTDSAHLIEIQGTAEGAVFSRAELDSMLLLAEKGIAELIALQEQVFSH